MKIKISTLFLLSLTAVSSWAQNRQRPPGGGPRELPAIAYEACSGKAEGDSVTDSNGVSGVCQTAPNGQLALRPSGPPPDGRAPQSASDAGTAQ